MFPDFASAVACKEYILTSDERIDSQLSTSVMIWNLPRPTEVSQLQTKGSYVTSLYVVAFPRSSLQAAMGFWRLSGLGISSRLARRILRSPVPKNLTQQVQDSAEEAWTPAHEVICGRIVQLLRRAPLDPWRLEHLTSKDVYLYPSGMSAIFHTHRVLLKWRNSSSIVFGFTYELTLKMLQTYGPGCKFYAFGTDEEIDHLEVILKENFGKGTKPQAIWCECASNPLLRTSDLARLRHIADRHGLLLVIDETICSFANVDVFRYADMVITSLTKSFSGYSDVMAGSVVLNPASRFYRELKGLFSETYRNNLFEEDAAKLEVNSRDFLQRAATMNENAQCLVKYFESLMHRPKSCIEAVYYPSLCWSVQNYRACMRAGTPSFDPGYGGLFTLQFASIATATAFFDNAAVHKGPSLGANVTLLQPYVQTVFIREKEWAARNGVKEAIVRVSVGLENKIELLAVFEKAMGEADRVAAIGRERQVGGSRDGWGDQVFTIN